MKRLLLAALLATACGTTDVDTLDAGPADADTTDAGPPPPAAYEAQFDPTNPIPILRIIPTPTGLLQNNGTGNLTEAAGPQACERPSTKQCLLFSEGGWPLNTPIALWFSGELDASSIRTGVRLLRWNEGQAPLPISFTHNVVPRPQIPPECFERNNGSDPPRIFDPDDVPPGDQLLILTPDAPLEPRTRYVVIVTNQLRDVEGTPIGPSLVFRAMNSSSAPAGPDGTITNAELRARVEGQLLDAHFPGKNRSELTARENAFLDAELTDSARVLFTVYSFIAATIDAIIAANLTTRDALIFVNAWTTADDPTTRPQLRFNPGNQVVPFPTTELFSTEDPLTGALRTNIPNPTNDPFITGVNQLDGFSTTAPITLPVSTEVDLTSIDPSPATPCTPDDCRIVMLAIEGAAMPEVPLEITTTAASILVRPARPLLQNQRYVVAVKRGLTALADGAPFNSARLFDYLKIDAPFVDAQNNVLDAQINELGATFQQAIECSELEATGQLLSQSQSIALARALEDALAHPRWLESFSALETAGVPRQELLMGFMYHTQSITPVVDFAKAALERETGCSMMTPCWSELRGAEALITGPLADIQGTQAIAQAIGIYRDICVPLCESGALAPSISPQDCATRDAQGNIVDINPALPGHPLCNISTQLFVSELDRLRLYMVTTFRVTAGGPFTNGTIDAQTLAAPVVDRIPIWVITGTVTSGADPQFPVAVFQHGFGSKKEAGFYLANTLAVASPSAAHGYATVLIDLPLHGERASDLIDDMTGRPCTNVDPADVLCDDPDGSGPQPINCMGGCDGVQDRSGTGFLSGNLFATRDNFRQATIDQLALLRAIRAESGPGGALAYLDDEHIGFVGQSLGGITGGNLAAYVERGEVDAFVLNVAGGSLVEDFLFDTAPAISGDLFAALVARGICEPITPGDPTSGCMPTPALERFKILAQWILDPADPLATSIGVNFDLRSSNHTPLGCDKILMQTALPDPVISSEASRRLQRAYGCSQNEIYDFTMVPRPAGAGCHAFLLAPVCGQCLLDRVCNTFGAQLQASGFIHSDGFEVGPPRRMFAGIDCNNPCAP